MCAHIIFSCICLNIPALISCSTKVRDMETALKLENIKSSAEHLQRICLLCIGCLQTTGPRAAAHIKMHSKR